MQSNVNRCMYFVSDMPQLPCSLRQFLFRACKMHLPNRSQQSKLLSPLHLCSCLIHGLHHSLTKKSLRKHPYGGEHVLSVRDSASTRGASIGSNIRAAASICASTMPSRGPRRKPPKKTHHYTEEEREKKKKKTLIGSDDATTERRKRREGIRK
jgi:hypothetical protein